MRSHLTTCEISDCFLLLTLSLCGEKNKSGINDKESNKML